jgi:pyruvate formate lyase activating enzyme
MALKESEKPKTLAYTYSEPTIFTEYMIDCAKAAQEAGLGNVVVSNGFMTDTPARELYSLVTAVKIDFKAFTDKFYEDICAGQLQPVLNTLKRLKDCGVWFEMVMLTIPTLNDNMDDIKRMAEWVVKELGPNVPLHFTRFHPDYKLRNLPQTPIETLVKARRVAMEQGCKFVYTGNAPGEDGQSTFCPKCKAVVIDRYGYSSKTAGMSKRKCGQCGEPIPGVWE